MVISCIRLGSSFERPTNSGQYEYSDVSSLHDRIDKEREFEWVDHEKAQAVTYLLLVIVCRLLPMAFMSAAYSISSSGSPLPFIRVSSSSSLPSSSEPIHCTVFAGIQWSASGGGWYYHPQEEMNYLISASCRALIQPPISDDPSILMVIDGGNPPIQPDASVYLSTNAALVNRGQYLNQ